MNEEGLQNYGFLGRHFGEIDDEGYLWKWKGKLLLFVMCASEEKMDNVVRGLNDRFSEKLEILG